MTALAFVYHSNPETDRPGDEAAMLASVREHYPAAPVIRAGQPPGGKAGDIGAWIAAYLRAGLESGAECFIRLDPDTRVLHPLDHIPLDCDVFGDVSWEAPMRRGRPPMVCGGAQGWVRSAAETALHLITRAVVLESRDGREPVNDDPVIARLIATFEVRVFAHPEISARGQAVTEKTAIWHPFPRTQF